jgi:hypothetical protein
MALFPIRQQTLTQFTGTAALGQTISFSVTRDFFLDSLFVVVPVTVAGTITSALTYSTMGLTQLVNRVQLQIADGSSNRNQTDSSGPALIRRAARVLNGLDVQTLSSLGASLNAAETNSAGSSAGTYYVTVPLLFRHPQISDPIGSATMLPLPRYNTNPSLVVTFGALTDAITTNHGATITIGTPYLFQLKRQVDTISFPTLDTEFREIVTAFNSTGPNQLQNLDVPGSYTMIDYYCTNSSNVGADISGGTWNLQFLSQVLRQFNLADVKRMEQYSMGNDSYLYGAAKYTDLFPGYYHQDFLNDRFGMEVGELGSVVNTNVLAGSGSQLQVLLNLASTGSVSFACERIFGDLSPYTFSFNTAAG